MLPRLFLLSIANGLHPKSCKKKKKKTFAKLPTVHFWQQTKKINVQLTIFCFWWDVVEMSGKDCCTLPVYKLNENVKSVF